MKMNDRHYRNKKTSFLKLYDKVLSKGQSLLWPHPLDFWLSSVEYRYNIVQAKSFYIVNCNYL